MSHEVTLKEVKEKTLINLKNPVKYQNGLNFRKPVMKSYMGTRRGQREQTLEGSEDINR